MLHCGISICVTEYHGVNWITVYTVVFLFGVTELHCVGTVLHGGISWSQSCTVWTLSYTVGILGHRVTLCITQSCTVVYFLGHRVTLCYFLVTELHCVISWSQSCTVVYFFGH